MSKADSMKDLYDRLETLGFRQEFIRENILPDWWEDDLAGIPANRAYVEMLLSRQLGLELSCLRDRSAELRTTANITARLKHKRNAAPHQLTAAQMLGWRVATAAALSMDHPFDMQEWSAREIRESILRSGASAVGLPQLLAFCWGAGIPAIHLGRVPKGGRRMDGMAVWTEERPVIVVANSRQRTAWHLFILAHELGHIARRHISEGQIDIDEKIEMKTTGTEEKEANEFAVELLAGTRDVKPLLPSLRLPSARDLASEMSRTGRHYKIDPGFLVLSYCHTKSSHPWPTGEAALRHLEGESVHEVFSSRYPVLGLDELPEDSRRVFECLTKAA